MSMSMNEIERALRELRLSGIRATLDTRVLQAQVNQEPFLDTFALILQDELDRRRSRLMERRYQQSGLDERMSLADFDWRFNAKLPRAACFELHTLKFVAEGQNALIIGRPGTGKSHIAKAVAYQATLQGHNVRYLEADGAFAAYGLGSDIEQRQQLRTWSTPTCWCWTICSSRAASATRLANCCKRWCTNATSSSAASWSPPTGSCRTGANTSATTPWRPPSLTG
jgi:hypothetical protein